MRKSDFVKLHIQLAGVKTGARLRHGVHTSYVQYKGIPRYRQLVKLAKRKEAIKAGKTVPGAALTKGTSMVIR